MFSLGLYRGKQHRDDTGRCPCCIIALNGFLKSSGIEVAWNQVINDPGQSRPEDNINMYNTSGTPTTPILIHDKFVQGAYPAHPASDAYTGSGINVADGDSTADADHLTAWVRAYSKPVCRNEGLLQGTWRGILFPVFSTANRIREQRFCLRKDAKGWDPARFYPHGKQPAL